VIVYQLVDRNGGFATSPLIGKYCGTTIDRFIRSHSNRLYLKFVSNAFITGRGFRIRYDGTTSGLNQRRPSLYAVISNFAFGSILLSHGTIQVL